MSYATNVEWANKSGLGLRVIDENVGTGDNSQLYFDLDNYNIVTGSYTLNYAASGSNNFTALTETTHYTIPDLESGRIILTTAGITALGTNILYATYTYTDSFSNDTITDFIATADSEVDKLTGRRWETSTAVSEYRSGRRSSQYPTTDNPYMTDWDAPDYIVLNQWPVVKVNFVHFLNEPQAVQKFFNYDLGTTTYTDKTTNVNSSTESPFFLFDASPATGDIIYIGSSSPFLGLQVNLSTLGVGASTIDWEYYDGSSWSDISETEIDTGASVFTASGKFNWTYPFGWSTTSVNSSTAYWIRGTLTDNYSVDPKIATLTLVDSVSNTLEPRQYLFKSNGELHFTGSTIRDGTNNIRIDYNYGISSVPAYITELSVLIASIKAYIFLTGGSYDAATSYTLGSKAVTIGEQYVNIREVLVQFKKRVDEILAMVGKRGDVVVL